MKTRMPWQNVAYCPSIRTGWEARRPRPGGQLEGGHDSFRIMHIVDGSYLYAPAATAEKQRLGPGSVLFLAPGDTHTVIRSPNTKENVIIFDVIRELETQPAPQEIWGINPDVLLPTTLAVRLREHMQPILALWWLDAIRRLRADGLLALLLSEIVEYYLGGYQSPLPVARPEAQVDQRVSMAERMFASRLNAWTTSDMASAVGMERSAFSRLYKHYRGESPGRLMDRARLSYALAALSGTDPSLSHIAASIGFSTQSSFARWFRRQQGCSPMEWHRLCRQP